ncbi:MAG: hypothetical protein ACYDBT_02525 [Desulfobulbaceae bacterium]
MNRRFLSLVSVVFVVLFMPALQVLGLDVPATLIEQAEAVFFAPGQPISLHVMVSDPAGIFAVRCYFRYQQDADYLILDMQGDGRGGYRGVLPAPEASVREIEYLYLAVNQHRQVVRTTPYTIRKTAGAPGAAFSTLPAGVVVLKSEIVDPPDANGLFLHPEQVRIEPVDERELFGLVAGLYGADDFPGTQLIEGYFGGYLQSGTERPLPLRGAMRKPDPVAAASGETTERFTGSADSTIIVGEGEVEIIGPDIRGDDWTGSCYFMGGRSGIILEEQQISVIVTQEGGSVTITTSSPCTFTVEGFITLGTFYWGSIDEAGNMELYDEQVPVQTWTTAQGPVSETSIMILDYATLPSEEDPYGDFYVIELQRDLTPPPPEPEQPVFLPAIYKMLLP